MPKSACEKYLCHNQPHGLHLCWHLHGKVTKPSSNRCCSSSLFDAQVRRRALVNSTFGTTSHVSYSSMHQLPNSRARGQSASLSALLLCWATTDKCRKLVCQQGGRYLSVELFEAFSQAKPAGQSHAVLGPSKDPGNGTQRLHSSTLLPSAITHETHHAQHRSTRLRHKDPTIAATAPALVAVPAIYTYI